MIAGVLELNILFLVAGVAVIWGLRGWDTWVDVGIHLGISYITGLCAVGVAATLALVAGFGLSTSVVVGLVLAIAACGTAIGLLRHSPFPRARGPLSVPRSLGDILTALAAAATVLVAFLMFRAFEHQPLLANDAFAFWIPKAKAIYFFGGLDPQLFRTLPAPSYPLFVPALDAMVFRFVHAADTTALEFQYWLLLVGFLGSAAALLRGIARRGLIWLFLAAGAVIPEIEHRFFQLLADWPLDVFFVLSALCLVRWLHTRERWLLPTYAIVLSAELATKREGQLLAACLFAGAAVATARTWRRSWPLLLSLSVAAYAVNVPWRIWWSSRNLTPDTPDGGLGHIGIHSFGRFFPSLRIVLELTFDYRLWLLCVPIALIAAVTAATVRSSRALAVFYVVTAATVVLGFTWVLWSDPTLPLSTIPRLTPIPRAVGSLALLSVAFAPVLVTGLVSEQPFPVLALPPAAAFRTGLPRLRDALASLSPVRVLIALVAVQWIAIAGLAARVRHAGWIFYMGGDQLWYYTTGWLLGHGHFPPAGIGYLLPALEAPLGVVRGPDLLQALPAIVLVNVLVLLPVAMVAIYGIAVRVGGRLFGYWAVALWILVPLVGITLTNTGYHQKYTELTLPQALGLTGLADFPALVATLVAVYFCARVLFDEQPQLLDGAAAGVAAGAAIGIKPSAALFLFGPALAFAAARRLQTSAAFLIGIAPAVITLTVWKWRGFGHLPLTGAYHGVKLAAGSTGTQVLGLNLHKYVNFDWSHFGNNLDLLREHFWSGHLIIWLAVAGAIGLARKSSRAFLLIVGWFGAYVLIKWTHPGSSIEDASLLRLMIPAYPAFVLILAALPFLLPHVARRVRAESGGFRPLSKTTRLRLVAAGVVITAAAPLAAIAVASPVRGPSPLAGFVQTPLIPASVDLGLRSQLSANAVSLAWSPQHPTGGPVFYRVYRSPVNAFGCSGPTAQRCQYSGTALGVAPTPEFVDHPPKGTWEYRIGLGANWLNDPTVGDVYLLSKPVQVTVP